MMTSTDQLALLLTPRAFALSSADVTREIDAGWCDCDNQGAWRRDGLLSALKSVAIITRH